MTFQNDREALKSKCEHYINLFVDAIGDRLGNSDKERDKEFESVLQEIDRLSIELEVTPFRIRFSGYKNVLAGPSWVYSWQYNPPLTYKSQHFNIIITDTGTSREAYSLINPRNASEMKGKAITQLISYLNSLPKNTPQTNAKPNKQHTAETWKAEIPASLKTVSDTFHEEFNQTTKAERIIAIGVEATTISLPTNTKCKDVTIYFKDAENIRILVNGLSLNKDTFSYSEIGFINKTTGKPKKAWLLFLSFDAVDNNILNTKNTRLRQQELADRMKEIRKILRSFFKGINEDENPILHDKHDGGVGYKPQFLIRHNPNIKKHLESLALLMKPTYVDQPHKFISQDEYLRQYGDND